MNGVPKWKTFIWEFSIDKIIICRWQAFLELIQYISGDMIFKMHVRMALIVHFYQVARREIWKWCLKMSAILSDIMLPEKQPSVFKLIKINHVPLWRQMMFQLQVEYDRLVAINETALMMLYLSLQSHCHKNHVRITENISFLVVDTQLRCSDLAKWYGTYPINTVKPQVGTCSIGCKTSAAAIVSH